MATKASPAWLLSALTSLDGSPYRASIRLVNVVVAPFGSDRPWVPETVAGRGPLPQPSPTAGELAAHAQAPRRPTGGVPAPDSEYRFECLSLVGPLGERHDRQCAAGRGGAGCRILTGQGACALCKTAFAIWCG